MKKLFTLLFLALSLSAFSTSVTFEVSMKGSGVTYDSVFVVGSQTDWLFVQMTDQGDSVFAVTLNLTEGDTATYYFITIGYWAANYLDYRETVPSECDSSAELAGWDGDRSFIVPGTTTKKSYIWNTCETVPQPVVDNTNENYAQNFELYPNPSEGIINVTLTQLNNQATLSILDVSGKSIRTIEVSDKQLTVDISDLPKGLYIVKISDEATTSMKKLLVR